MFHVSSDRRPTLSLRPVVWSFVHHHSSLIKPHLDGLKCPTLYQRQNSWAHWGSQSASWLPSYQFKDSKDVFKGAKESCRRHLSQHTTAAWWLCENGFSRVRLPQDLSERCFGLFSSSYTFQSFWAIKPVWVPKNSDNLKKTNCVIRCFFPMNIQSTSVTLN